MTSIIKNLFVDKQSWPISITEDNNHFTGFIKIKDKLLFIIKDNIILEEVYYFNSFTIKNVSSSSILFSYQDDIKGIRFQSDLHLQLFLECLNREDSPNNINDDKIPYLTRAKSISSIHKFISDTKDWIINPATETTDIIDINDFNEYATKYLVNITLEIAKEKFFLKEGFSFYQKLDNELLFSSKGELGTLPILCRDYKNRLHKNGLTDKWPTKISPEIVSEKWSEFIDKIWVHIRNQFIISDYSPNSIFKFTWRGVKKDIKDKFYWENIITTTHIPIHFILSNNQVWELQQGKFTPGTCYRKAKDSLSNDRKWLSNSICNFYKIEMFKNSLQDKEHYKAFINLYRHGIVGFENISMIDSTFLVSQVYLVLLQAINDQQKLLKPLRIVSHNLVNQTKLFGTMNRERYMITRQESIFSAALQMVIQQGACIGNYKASLLHFYLPTNTDKGVLKIADSELGINNRSSLRYLRWLCEDCFDVFSKLVASEPELIGNYTRGLNNKDSRWKNQKPLSLLKIPLKTLLNDLIYYCPSEEIMLSELLSIRNTKSWLNLFNALLNNVDDKEHMLLHGYSIEQNQLQSFLRCMLLILSSIGLSIYNSLLHHKESLPQIIYQGIKQDVERCRISINLLRTLYHSEVFSFKIKEGTDFSEYEGILGGRTRVFSRATSLLVAGLLDYCLGACIFVNCKSGLDRTGLFVGVETSLISLWELYPHKRWELHLVCINFNLLRRIVTGGRFQKETPQMQPPSVSVPIRQGEYSLKAEDILAKISTYDIAQDSIEERITKVTDNLENKTNQKTYFNVTKVLYDANELLSFGLPMFFLIRNYNLAYLIDINGLITYASTGLRGMKYRKHFVAGPLLPSSVTTPNGEMVNIIKKTPSIAGGGLADFLSEEGNDILVDLAGHRKS